MGLGLESVVQPLEVDEAKEDLVPLEALEVPPSFLLEGLNSLWTLGGFIVAMCFFSCL
jgi:hypothetical protein